MFKPLQGIKGKPNTMEHFEPVISPKPCNHALYAAKFNARPENVEVSFQKQRNPKVLLFDFSGSFLTFRLFGQQFKKSNFSREKNVTSRTTGDFSTFRENSSKFYFRTKKRIPFRHVLQFSHFSTFRATIQKIKLFAEKMSLFEQLVTFRFSGNGSKKLLLEKTVTFQKGQFSPFSTFRANLIFTKKKIQLFAKLVTFRRLGDFSQKVAFFSFSGNVRKK